MGSGDSACHGIPARGEWKGLALNVGGLVFGIPHARGVEISAHPCARSGYPPRMGSEKWGVENGE